MRGRIEHSLAMANEPSAPRRLSKGVIIRLAIYVPLLGFFGWRAADKAISEREAADEVFRDDLDRLLESPPGIIDLGGLIPIDAQAELSAPVGFEVADETAGESGGTTTGEALDATGTTSGTTSGTTTGEALDATSTGTTSGTTSGGEPELDPTSSTSTTTSTGP